MRELIESVCSGFTEFDPPPDESVVDGPIGWPGYDAARRRARERTGERESVICGSGKIGDVEATLIVFEFGFLGGSVGRRTGDRIEAAFTRARELRTPVVSLIATGGSRMQEGMAALSQLQRIARQVALTRAAGIPQISVLRDPTTGGGWATLGAGADVVLALPGAQVGFAGSRVRPPGNEQAYTAESQLASGHVDQIVNDLPVALARWLTLLTQGTGGAPEPPTSLRQTELPQTGWDAVLAARAPERPRADAYLDAYFDWRENVSGDRCGGVDAGVHCGFGSRNGMTIAYAAQCGTATLPSGFRTAARLIRLADRLGIPVLTLVDTPGAANDGAAERAGAGAGIAEVFGAIAAASVPVTTLVIGEGGSGGALAFAAPGRTWVTPDSYFSVTSPEAAAAILKRPPEEIPATAEQLRLRPQDLVELGVVQGIV
ncbi:acetyl-CoA carboxylase carboxyl transferase subunit beta [Amycolatopsis bartoniae]|uniref:Acetyl-coenzyme A carboxylase carboxyl transferase subunits beta/alpha n=1 Tax=Amycolatopsis bartoniae TaxID=941986 RepID=A0A8H9J3N4_9PSEU|nr:carboxyl transferase domain-containing protein [Amycolatopsis bartoniae]MBB2933907.1 acetyl-CoA carboxylase carboxyl transferase subunit beta [Amycolatopsis bartoniae]TVT01464.1 acetyl-CoA carboxylase [Amycolatopsis bartoniae]GHF88226.1 acetyl-CoA carboxylase [Amycolatopsis bartoniae]